MNVDTFTGDFAAYEPTEEEEAAMVTAEVAHVFTAWHCATIRTLLAAEPANALVEHLIDALIERRWTDSRGFANSWALDLLPMFRREIRAGLPAAEAAEKAEADEEWDAGWPSAGRDLERADTVPAPQFTASDFAVAADPIAAE